jgi:hypothetical protein
MLIFFYQFSLNLPFLKKCQMRLSLTNKMENDQRLSCLCVNEQEKYSDQLVADGEGTEVIGHRSCKHLLFV